MENTSVKKTNIFLLHGENNYSSSIKLKFWKDQFQKKYGEESTIETFESEKIEIKQFKTNLKSLPFLCEKRMIIIKNLFKTKDELKKQIYESLKTAPDFCVIIIYEDKEIDKKNSLYKKFTQIITVEEFKNPSLIEINKWILKKAEQEGFKISMTNANFLVQQTGPDLWKIANELNKLKFYSQNQEITQKMIEETVTPTLSASIFQLTDYLSQKRTKESINTFEKLIDSGEEISKIFHIIVKHFRNLIQVHFLLENNENKQTILKILKLHPFVVQKTIQQSKNFTKEKLSKIHNNLLEIEIQSKTGQIRVSSKDINEYKLAMEKFFLNCCA